MGQPANTRTHTCVGVTMSVLLLLFLIARQHVCRRHPSPSLLSAPVSGADGSEEVGRSLAWLRPSCRVSSAGTRHTAERTHMHESRAVLRAARMDGRHLFSMKASASGRLARARAAWLRRGRVTIGGVPSPPAATTPARRHGDEYRPTRTSVPEDKKKHSLEPAALSLTSSASRAPSFTMDATTSVHICEPLPLVYHAFVRSPQVPVGGEDGDDDDDVVAHDDVSTRCGSLYGSSLPLGVSQWGLDHTTSVATASPTAVPSSPVFEALLGACVEQPLSPALKSLLRVPAQLTQALRETSVSLDCRLDAFGHEDVQRLRAFSRAISQRVPSLVALSETSAHGACDTPPPSPQTLTSITWRCPDGRLVPLPVTVLPVSIRVQRVHVGDVFARITASCLKDDEHGSAFARQFQKAQKEMRQSAWWAAHAVSAYAPHCVWNGLAWVLEEDPQLVAAQEAWLWSTLGGHDREFKRDNDARRVPSLLRAWLPANPTQLTHSWHTLSPLISRAYVHARVTWLLPKVWQLTGLQLFLAAEGGATSRCRVRAVESDAHAFTAAPRQNDDAPMTQLTAHAVMPLTGDVAMSRAPQTGRGALHWWLSLPTSQEVHGPLHFPAYDAATGLPLRSYATVAVATHTSSRRARQPHHVAHRQLFCDEPVADDADGAVAVPRERTNPFALSIAAQLVSWWPLRDLLVANRGHNVAEVSPPTARDLPSCLPWPLLSDDGLCHHLQDKRGSPPRQARTKKKKTQRAATGRGGESADEARRKWLYDASAVLHGEKNLAGFFAHTPPQWLLEEMQATERQAPTVRAPDAGDDAVRVVLAWLRREGANPTHPQDVVWETTPACGAARSRRTHEKKKNRRQKGDPSPSTRPELVWVLEHSPWLAEKGVASGRASSPNRVRWHVYAVTENDLLNYLFPLPSALAWMAPSTTSSSARQGGLSTQAGEATESTDSVIDMAGLVARGRVFIEIRAALWLLTSSPAGSSASTPLRTSMTALLSPGSAQGGGGAAGCGRWSAARFIDALLLHAQHRQSWPAAEYNIIVSGASEALARHEDAGEPRGHQDDAQCLAEPMDTSPPVGSSEDVAADDDWGVFTIREGNDESSDPPAVDRRAGLTRRRPAERSPSRHRGAGGTPSEPAQQTALEASLIAARTASADAAEWLVLDPPSLTDTDDDVVSGTSSPSGFLRACEQAELRRLRRRWGPWQRYLAHRLRVEASPLRSAIDQSSMVGAAMQVTSWDIGLSTLTLQTETRYVNAANTLPDECAVTDAPHTN